MKLIRCILFHWRWWKDSIIREGKVDQRSCALCYRAWKPLRGKEKKEAQ